MYEYDDDKKEGRIYKQLSYLLNLDPPLTLARLIMSLSLTILGEPCVQQ